MHRTRTTTSTVTAPIRSEATWSKDTTIASSFAKSDSQAEQKLPSESTPPESNKNNNNTGFYEKTTLWEQELHRYKFTPWLVVRVGTLIAFPYVMSALGAKLVWPQVVAFGNYLGLETSDIAQPASTIISIVAFSILNSFYTLLYYYDIPVLDQYRIDDKPWHWEMDPEGWKTMLRNTIGLIVFNAFCVTPPVMVFIRNFLVTNQRVDMESLPGGGEVFWQLMFCLVLEDFGFHHAHQLLHTKQFYWIHKTHHRFHAPIGIASVYAHPIEYVIGNILPSMLGPALLQNRMHGWTYCIWIIFRSSAAVENHSGYEFPWSMFQAIPFKAPTEYHDFHHSKNKETYSGVLRFWDWVYGTNQQYFNWVRAGRPQQKSKKGTTVKKQN